MVERDDPFSALRFRVGIDGLAVAAFSECSGLSAETDVIQYRSGADATIRKLPGAHKYSDIQLKRGVTPNKDLWSWYKTVLDGNVQRRNGVVILLDDSGQEVVRWKFHQGWPCKYEAPTFNAAASEVAIETLEIAHEGLERV